MEDLESIIEDRGLLIEDRHSRFEGLIVPHQHFDTHISIHPLSQIPLFWGHC